jgi:hypothetical protein
MHLFATDGLRIGLISEDGRCRSSDSRCRVASKSAAYVRAVLPGAALGGSATCRDLLAPGYYRPPFQGFQFAAAPTVMERSLIDHAAKDGKGL